MKGAHRLGYVTFLVAILCAPVGNAFAHALDPGFIAVRALSESTYAVSFKVPQAGGAPLPLQARLPENCSPRQPGSLTPAGNAFLAKTVTHCPGGLGGGRLVVDGLPVTSTDVLVHIEWLDGTTRTDRLTPDQPTLVIAGPPTALEQVRTYLLLGIEHILLGIDHLLFVLALILLVRGGMRVVKTVTAFTVAHSITLSAATLGYVHVPVPPVEAVIALSILFVAVEVLKRGNGPMRLAERQPWMVAFAFGLLHGFGFAGALAEAGIPEPEIPTALLLFNVGVELGQIAFIGAVFLLWRGIRLIPVRWPAPVRALPVYLIGTLAAYWTVERTLSAFYG
jgi:hydrogenase/urease accessory protein HupE